LKDFTRLPTLKSCKTCEDYASATQPVRWLQRKNDKRNKKITPLSSTQWNLILYLIVKIAPECTKGSIFCSKIETPPPAAPSALDHPSITLANQALNESNNQQQR